MEKKFAVAAKPANESERLEALRQLNVLDTAPTAQLDELARLASRICGTSMALVSLVDQDRQWFKARVGIDAIETPRDVAFCSHAILESEPLVVPDATLDERFAENPLVSGELGLRFYGGAPLITSSGHSIGTLCVLDKISKSLSPEQIDSLAILAKQVVYVLEAQRALALEHALEEAWISEGVFRSMFENFPIGMIQLNSRFQFLRVNQSFADFLGYSRSELADLNVLDVTHPDDREKSVKGVASITSQGKDVHRLEKRYVHKSGATVWGLLSIRKVKDPDTGEDVYFTAVKDVTLERQSEAELKIAQAKLVESAKFASLGEMAAGVAHEINNPLAIISVKAQLMLEQISEGPIDLTKARKDLSTITATAERIAVTVRGLRMFSRSSENDSQTPNFLHQIVNQTLDLCAERFKLGGVEIKKDLGDDIQFSCRPAQISQVLLNLVSNAFDAVQSSEEKWVRVLARVSGETVRIEVSDGGPGIPQTVRERIMEPFFTTKPPGHGTGLGLSISRGILEAHGGTLSLEPAEAHTTFRLELPILVKASKPRAA